MYRVTLPEPSNFGKYRQHELDAQLLGSYGSADGISYLSKRFNLSRFLQMTEAEIKENERLKLTELGFDPDDDSPEAIKAIYGAAEGEMGGLGGGMGGLGGGFGGAELGMGAETETTGGEAGGAPPSGEPGGI